MIALFENCKLIGCKFFSPNGERHPVCTARVALGTAPDQVNSGHLAELVSSRPGAVIAAGCTDPEMQAVAALQKK